MSETKPTVSVIIPTHNRSSSLKRSLDALSVQSYPSEQMEVIVVADGCSDDTLEMLKSYEAPFAVRAIEQSGQGPAVARNQGAASATGTVLIFLDDDIEATPQLVEAHVSAHQQPKQVVIGYLPTILQTQTGFFRITLRGWWEAMFHPMRQPSYRYGYSDLLSGNFSVSATLFAEVGGFDPAFRCHEDYELGVRLLKAGGNFTFAPSAMGYHHEMTGIDRSMQRKYQEGRADVQLGRKYPELKPILLLSTLIARCSLLDRLILILIFQIPALSDLLAKGLRHVLTLLEWMRMRGYWQALLYRLLGYWYLRGVAEESSTRQALASFLQGESSQANGEDVELELDLQEGLAVVERQLDEKRPASVRIRYGQHAVGRIPSKPGTEQLRGVHIRPVLATTLAWPLLLAMALEGPTDTAITPECLPAALSAQSRENVHAY